ncbi:integrin alpha [Myxococcota bacterium]|nr:integrin alpha [Myxococcota bacterium]
MLGWDVAIDGDFDGDGADDVLIGNRGHVSGGPGSGGALVFLGPRTGTSYSADADARLRGESSGNDGDDNAGMSVAFAGDVGSDGWDDLVIGAWRNDAGCDDLADGGCEDTGAAYVVFGPTYGEQDLADEVRLTGGAEFDYAGFTVAGAGDVDGDGFGDLLVGAFQESGSPGLVHLLLGPIEEGGPLSGADATFEGEDEWDSAGHAVAGGGDVNGDGFADILVGAPENDEAARDAGIAYLLLGAPR